MKNKMLATIFFVSLFLSSFTLLGSSVSAKVTDTVEGGNIQYLTRANATFSVPTTVDFKVGTYQVPSITIQATYTEESTYSSGHSSMIVSIKMPSGFVPLGIITTNPATAEYLKTAFRNLPVYKPGPPPLNNVKVLSDEELKVDRHGNSISVTLNPSNSIIFYMPTPAYPSGPTYPLQMPALTINFEKYGGSLHNHIVSNSLVQYSGFVTDLELMGFNANAALNCQSWGLNNALGTDAFITMHGVQYWIPPS
jgi:hypothetical protein